MLAMHALFYVAAVINRSLGDASMLVFVDESGDPGMKLGQGSSPFFVVTAVWFDDHEAAQSCDDAIGLLRKELGWPMNREFHFSHQNESIRKRFLTLAVKHDFFYMSFGLNKALVDGDGFRVKESLTKFVSRLVFENAKPHLEEAIVVFDGSGAKEFRQQFANYLKRRINPTGGIRHIKKVKIQDSQTNNLIQLADMVCGAVTRSITHGDDQYRRLIRIRELRVQIWPK